MSEIVERVARALEPQAWAVLGLQSRDSIAYQSRRTASLRKARTAIKALKDLTPEMRKAGEAEMMARHTNLDCFHDPYVDSTWKAMLDAALSQSGDSNSARDGV